MQTRIVEMDPRALKLLEVNARFMEQAKYRRLVENVRKDGRLTSVPFACLYLPPPSDPLYEVLSGNHRVRAAIDAGLETVWVMVTDEDLPRERRTAIQLSHNSLEGEDDPATLRRLYESLEVDWKAYSGLDDKTLGLLAKVEPGSLHEAVLDFQTLTIAFLPDEIERVDAALKAARSNLKGADVRWAARWAEYDRLLDAISDVSAAHGITNVATAVMGLLAIYERHQGELCEGWECDGLLMHKGLVPIGPLFAPTGRMPAAEAQKVRRAVEKLVARKQAPKDAPWQALVAWADSVLGTDPPKSATVGGNGQAVRDDEPRPA